MRNLLLVANALVAVLFAAFFVYTFLGRGHIEVEPLTRNVFDRAAIRAAKTQRLDAR